MNPSTFAWIPWRAPMTRPLNPVGSDPSLAKPTKPGVLRDLMKTGLWRRRAVGTNSSSICLFNRVHHIVEGSAAHRNPEKIVAPSAAPPTVPKCRHLITSSEQICVDSRFGKYCKDPQSKLTSGPQLLADILAANASPRRQP